MPFIVNNLETGIIINVQKLLVGTLIPKIVTLETDELLRSSKKNVGSMCLVLTDNANKHHTYDIPEYEYNPESPINIIGVPYLGKYSGYQATGLYKYDGTTVKSGSKKAHFFCDHGNQ